MTNKQAFLYGMKFAAEIVNLHWNDSYHVTNQKEQALRSAAAINRRALDMMSEWTDKEFDNWLFQYQLTKVL